MQFDSTAINVRSTSFHDDVQGISRKIFNNPKQRNDNIPKSVVEKVKICIEEKVKEIDCKLSSDRNAARNLNYYIRSAIAEYCSKNEAYLNVAVENLQPADENDMEWSPSQSDESPMSVSIQEYERLKKELLESQAQKEYWRERCQTAENEVETLKKLRSGVKQRQSKAEKIGSELIRIFDRVEKNAVSPEMTELIISWFTKAQQSSRQIEKFLDLLLEKIPSLQSSLKPSQSSISRVTKLLPNVNLIHAVQFLNNSNILSLAFDETNKFRVEINATLLINEDGESFVISAVQCIDKSATSIAGYIMRELAQVAVAAKEHGLIEGDQLEWLEQQHLKIRSVISDSCNVAKKTRDLLREELNEALANPDHPIDVIDCSMHVISNSESKMKKSLRSPAASVLKIVSEDLAHNFSRLCADWNNTHRQRFITEVGSRFEQSSKNALLLLQSWDDLIEFAALRPDNRKMVDLYHLLSTRPESIKSDLLAFTSTWFLLVSPTWNKLKTADGHASISLIDNLKERMTSIIDGSSRASIIREAAIIKETENAAFILTMLDVDSTELDASLKRCNQAALKYFEKVTGNWAIEEFSDETLLMPFTNQRVESFFGALDRIAKITPGSNVATRLELGRARWNDVSKFLKDSNPTVIKYIMKTRSSGGQEMRERQERVKELLYQKTRANEIERTDYFEKI